MHARAVPVGRPERLAVELDVDAVFFRQALQQVAGHPHFVGGLLGALAENLELPLALRHFGVDAFVIDAGVEAEVEMLLDDLARDIADVRIADARVIGALRGRIALVREAERTTVLVEEVLLLEAEPGAGIVENGRACIGFVRGDAIRHHDFAHDEHAVGARAVRENCDWLQYAIGAAALGLLRRRTVETPQRQLVERREAFEFLDLRLATQVRHRLVAVEPNVLEFVFGHLLRLQRDISPERTRLGGRRANCARRG